MVETELILSRSVVLGPWIPKAMGSYQRIFRLAELALGVLAGMVLWLVRRRQWSLHGGDAKIAYPLDALGIRWILLVDSW